MSIQLNRQSSDGYILFGISKKDMEIIAKAYLRHLQKNRIN